MENYQNNNLPEGNSHSIMDGQNMQTEYQQNYHNANEGNPQYYSYPPNMQYRQDNYAPQNPYYGRATMPEEISTWKFLGMMWVSAIPVVGIILILIWAFSNDQINRRNYARAILLNIAITLILSIAFWGVMMAFFIQLIDVLEKQHMYMQ